MFNIRSEEKNLTEYHFPGYNFCGPGTKVFTRLTRGDKGVNQLDEACKCHDIEYMMYAGDDKNLEKSDNRLRDKAREIGGFESELVDNIFLFKRILGKKK
jgi:hypothetical protein